LLRFDTILIFHNCAVVFHGAVKDDSAIINVAPATWWADCVRELRREKDNFESHLEETQNTPHT
jgi:hypothetical protein